MADHLHLVHGRKVVPLTRQHRGTRRTHRPAPDGRAGVAAVLDAYARQADELARMVEDWQASCTRYARALGRSLGELHVALDEAASGPRGGPAGGDESA